LKSDRSSENIINSVTPYINEDIEYVRACFHVAKGETDIALSFLQKGLKNQDTSRVWARKDPNFEVLREDLRFKELVGLT